MAVLSGDSDREAQEKLARLDESWNDSQRLARDTAELHALQDSRLEAWLSHVTQQTLPRLLSSQASPDMQLQPASLAAASITPLEICVRHQADVILGYWDSVTPQFGSLVLAQATAGRASPAVTARASTAAAQFLAAIAAELCSSAFLGRVLACLAAPAPRKPVERTLQALLSAPRRLGNAIGTLDSKQLPQCLGHDALGESFCRALVDAAWLSAREPPSQAGTPSVALDRFQTAATRARQSGWSVHLAVAMVVAFEQALCSDPPSQALHTPSLLDAHAAVCRSLWAACTRPQAEAAAHHLLHSPPLHVPDAITAKQPWCATPLYAAFGPPCKLLSSASILASTIKRQVPQRVILTPYGAQQWMLYCSSATVPAAAHPPGSAPLSWGGAFDALGLADAWSAPLSVAALDTDLQQSMTGVLAFLVRNAPPEQVLLGTPLGTSLMRGAQERLGVSNLRVKAAGMLIGSVLSRAAAAASRTVMGVELPLLDWTAAMAAEVQTNAEKAATKQATDQAAEEAFKYLHLPMQSPDELQQASSRLQAAWVHPVLPSGLPPPPGAQQGGAQTQMTSATTKNSSTSGNQLSLRQQQAGTASQHVTVFREDASAKLPCNPAPPVEFPDSAPRDEPAVLLGRTLPPAGASESELDAVSRDGAMAFALRMAAVTQRDRAHPGQKEEVSTAAAASGVPVMDGFVRATASSGQDAFKALTGGQTQGGEAEQRGGGDKDSRPVVANSTPAAKYGQLPAPPSHLREIMKTLRDPPDYKHYISALAAVGPLVRALRGRPETAHEIHDTAVPLLRVLLGASNQFGLSEFAEWQQDAMLAVVECSPLLAAQWLTKVVFAQEQLLGVRIQLLHVLAAGALALSNSAQATPRGGGAASGPVSAGDDTAVNALIEELVQHVGGDRALQDDTDGATPGHKRVAGGGKGGQISNGGRTRRWGVGAAKARRKAAATAPRVNAFAAVAGDFMLPLLRRVMDPTSGVNVLGSDGAELLAALCRTLALMLEAAASAPNVSMLCGEVLHFVRVVHTHDASGVRVGALCLVLACAETVHRLQLQEHALPPAGSPFLAAAVGGGVGQDAELLRSALGQHSAGGGALATGAGVATKHISARLHGTRTLLSAVAQRSAAGAAGSSSACTQGEVMHEMASWVRAVSRHDPDAECRALAQRVGSAASLQHFARTEHAMVSLLEMMEV